MEKRILKKSEVLREGYIKGLKKAQGIIKEQIESQTSGFVCPMCGNNEFHAHQECYHDVRVDGYGDFVDDEGVYESSTPYGPFTCTNCDEEFDNLG